MTVANSATHIQDARRAAAGIDRVRHDAGVGQGDHPFHACDQIADLGDFCREAAVSPFDGRAPLRPRHDAHQWQRTCRTAGEIRIQDLDNTLVAVIACPRTGRSRTAPSRGAIVVEREGQRCPRPCAKRGVVLACGGFPHDVERRKSDVSARPNRRMSIIRPDQAAIPATDCGWRRAVGGRVEDTPAECGAAWVPVSAHQAEGWLDSGVMPHFIDRAKPGVIAVMRDGARFANEGNSYHDFVQDMMKAAKPGEEIAAYPDLRSRRRCANMAWDAYRRFQCRSDAISSRPATSSAAAHWRSLRLRLVSMSRAFSRQR